MSKARKPPRVIWEGVIPGYEMVGADGNNPYRISVIEHYGFPEFIVEHCTHCGWCRVGMSGELAGLLLLQKQIDELRAQVAYLERKDEEREDEEIAQRVHGTDSNRIAPSQQR